MAKKIALAFDISGTTITDGNGATIQITFHDQHKGVRELDTIDEEAEKLGGRRVEARLSSADETGITASGLCAERLPLLDLEARRAVRRFRAAASSFASAPMSTGRAWLNC